MQNISILDDKNDRYTDLLDYAASYFQNNNPNNFYSDFFNKNFHYNKENQIYELSKDSHLDNGALTSLKPLKSPNDLIEIKKALALTPLFKEAKKLFPKSPWIYYSSENFIYIYPYVNSKEFKFSPEILTTEFHLNNLPKNNPSRSVIWTNPYFDLAGKGMMITKSKPIYIQDEFHGAVSIDVKISDISEHINYSQFDMGKLYIVNQLGNLIISNVVDLNSQKSLIQIYKPNELSNFHKHQKYLISKEKIVFYKYSTKNNFMVSCEINLFRYLLMILSSQYISFLLFIVGLFFFIWWKREKKLLLRTEAENIQKNKLLSLAEMSGGIAHEINNPLTVILGRANQSLKKINNDNFTKEEIVNNLEKISFSAERIGKIITTLKNFSRNDSEEIMQKIALEKIISESLLLCENRINNESTTLKIDSIPSLEINCHAYQIIQILINLINNSFDATSNLKEKWIKITFEKTEDFIEIKITDSGNGIAKENLDKIFEPFFTTKPINYGTGLGLSISKKIAINHKGDLIYDQRSKNTCFILKLPWIH